MKKKALIMILAATVAAAVGNLSAIAVVSVVRFLFETLFEETFSSGWALLH